MMPFLIHSPFLLLKDARGSVIRGRWGGAKGIVLWREECGTALA
jgi:hypothetical protein